jgi:UDP-N-acetylglucosamine--N-acetylmuramyl-(pentapeptide) pyrophosphoryl-undecaprenol N-acetylglucosamine transferase
VLLVMGGSQGAKGINDLILRVLFNLVTMAPQLQILHLTGAADHERVRAAYAAHRARAVVRPFLDEMDLALAAATAAISRAGASSLAELAAMRIPAVLVPYPFAADNHQLHNARAFVDAGAGRLLEQGTAKPEELVWLVLELTGNVVTRSAMTNALARWHSPNAAAAVAGAVLFGAGLQDAVKPSVPARTPSATRKPG